MVRGCFGRMEDAAVRPVVPAHFVLEHSARFVTRQEIAVGLFPNRQADLNVGRAHHPATGPAGFFHDRQRRQARDVGLAVHGDSLAEAERFAPHGAMVVVPTGI
jgi:hypothetical protein